MSPFLWQSQNLCWLSLAFIIDWRAVCRVSSNSPSRIRDKYTGRSEWKRIVSYLWGDWYGPQANRWFIYEEQTGNNWIVGQTWWGSECHPRLLWGQCLSHGSRITRNGKWVCLLGLRQLQPGTRRLSVGRTWRKSRFCHFHNVSSFFGVFVIDGVFEQSQAARNDVLVELVFVSALLFRMTRLGDYQKFYTPWGVANCTANSRTKDHWSARANLFVVLQTMRQKILNQWPDLKLSNRFCRVGSDSPGGPGCAIINLFSYKLYGWTKKASKFPFLCLALASAATWKKEIQYENSIFSQCQCRWLITAKNR